MIIYILFMYYIDTKVWKTWRLIPWKLYGNLWVHISLRFLFLGNSFPIQWKFQGNFNRNFIEIPWKLRRNSIKVLLKFYRNGIQILLHWYNNYMDTWIDRWFDKSVTSDHIWRLWCQKRVSQTWMSNCIPCHRILASDPKVLIWSSWSSLTHGNGVTHICVHKLCHFCFKWWRVTCSSPSYYENQCWHIVNWTLII